MTRVSALATGGEVLVSDAAREVELKGLPGTHLVWRVVPS